MLLVCRYFLNKLELRAGSGPSQPPVSHSTTAETQRSRCRIWVAQDLCSCILNRKKQVAEEEERLELPGNAC